MQNYKFLNHIVLWNIFFAIICIPTAGKLIDVVGTPLSISIYYFPFVYIFADILTEVYGYAVARRVLWYCVSAQVVTIVIFEFVILYPPSAVMTNNQSYVDVLSAAPRLVLFGTFAMYAGDIANNALFVELAIDTTCQQILIRSRPQSRPWPRGGRSPEYGRSARELYSGLNDGVAAGLPQLPSSFQECAESPRHSAALYESDDGYNTP